MKYRILLLTKDENGNPQWVYAKGPGEKRTDPYKPYEYTSEREAYEKVKFWFSGPIMADEFKIVREPFTD